MIKLEEVSEGDEVTIQDRARNLAVGTVRTRPGEMWIEVFGEKVVIAELQPKGEWKGRIHARVVGHIPTMV